jgi:hypothetical protein
MTTKTERMLNALMYFMFCVAISAFAMSVFGAEVALPYANFDGYETTLTIANPTGEAIPVPDYWRPFGIGSQPVTVQSLSIRKEVGWPRNGGGIGTFDLPEGLHAKVQIKDPNGKIFDVLPLEAIGDDVSYFFDIDRGDDFKAFVFIGSPDGSPFTFSEYGSDYGLHASDELRPGEMRIFELRESMASVTRFIPVGPSLYKGKLYCFVLISHQPDGEHVVVYPIK